MDNFIYTSDYFTYNIPHWEKILTYLNSTFGKNLNCLEVGTWEGRSAIYLLDNFVGDAELTVIDHFVYPKIKSNYFYNISQHPKCGQVKTMHGSSLTEMPKLLDGPLFDFIYIDAGKTAVDNLFNLIVGERLLKENGIMVVDDFGWAKKNVEYKAMPKLGILSFIETSLLCEVFMKDYQVCFKKIRNNDVLSEIKK